jgi:TonB family protein
MNVRIASPAFVAVLVLLSGCSGAEPETGNAKGAVVGQPEGYGYDFEVDRFGPAGAAKPGPIAAPAAGVRMPPETIQSVVRAGAGPFAACYQTVLAAQPGLAGEVVLRFTIDASGAPQGTKVEKSTVPAGAFQGCVLAAFDTLRFPASSAGVLAVKYPLGFAP